MTFKEIPAWFEARPERERIIMSLLAMSLIGVLLLQLLIDPAFRKKSLADGQNLAIAARIEALEVQIPLMDAAAKKDPNEALQLAFAQQTQALDELNGEIRQRMASLVEPSEMVAALNRLLDKQGGVKLVDVRNLPVVPVFVTPEVKEDDAVASKKKKAPRRPDLFRHGLRITMEGDFFSLLNYLLRVEQLDARFAWEALRYDVTTYPKARVEIELQTLSLEEDWLGV